MLLGIINSVSIETMIWLFPIMFMLHDFEEIIMVEGWISQNKNKVRNILPKSAFSKLEKHLDLTTSQFTVAVILMFIIISWATVTGIYSIHKGSLPNLFIIMVLVAFLHVFTHLGQAIIMKGYIPGVITAVLIILPYSWYILYEMLYEKVISWRTIYISIPFCILAIPIVILGQLLGKKLVKW